MSPLFCVTLLLIIALLGVHSYKSLGVWWGYPMTLVGLFGVAVGVAAAPLAAWLGDKFLGGSAPAGMSPILLETGSDLAVQIIRSLFTQIRNFSLIAVGMGLGIIISTSVLKKPGKDDEKEERESTSPESESDESGEPEEEADSQEKDDPHSADVEDNHREGDASKEEESPEPDMQEESDS
jgi:hypothetical protein